MRRKFGLLGVLMALLPALGAAETVRLKATADIWLSDANPQERSSSAGKANRFKLKTIQEMGAIRFDASPAKGREVLKAALLLRRAGADKLRYVRVSTVNGDWVEGNTAQQYGQADGATYMYADHAGKRPWTWPGSQFCDAIMGAGNTLVCWAERKELEDGWIAVELAPELVYALVAGDSDGLAVMDGGNLAYQNNFIYSCQAAGSEPYVEVELGKRLTAAPPTPQIKAEPAPERAHLASGAVKVTISGAGDVFCWRLALDGRPAPRWCVKHPAANGPTIFYLEDLAASKRHELEVAAVGRGGAISRPAKVAAFSSPALSGKLSLGKLAAPRGGGKIPQRAGKMRVWACPGIVKISPEKPEAMFGDLGGAGDPRGANGVWDGKRISLFGARGEYVSYQLCIEKLSPAPLTGVKVRPEPLKGPGAATIGGTEIELFTNWYARNTSKKWQPAYCVPIAAGQAFAIPDPRRQIAKQQNQTVYVDVYVPKKAAPGEYTGSVRVEADGVEGISLPVALAVYDFVLPDRLGFWPELNAYNVPRDAHEYYRLAHQHRCVMNCWVWRPQLQGSGKGIRVIWDRYDRDVGPLLTGQAFKGNRRAGAPVECMYLPFEDSWPTPLSKSNYNYQGYWPKRGDGREHIVAQQLKAPYIGDALSQDYKDAFLAVEKQFIAHFKAKGYTRTEMQCFYGGKNTHRIDYGSNMWWTTDEPYHWEDWLALQFFCRLWTQGRGQADASRWAARADISRPQWQAMVLAGAVDAVYYGTGAFSSAAMYRRCRTLHQETGLDLRTYGGANRDDESNTRSVVWILNAWANGSNAVLPWQTLAGEKALDANDSATSGNALIAPATRLGLKVVGDMRLKALRTGEQLAEYMILLAQRHKLTREQIKAMVHAAVSIQAGTRAGAGADNADALVFGTLKAWQIVALRRALAELIVKP